MKSICAARHLIRPPLGSLTMPPALLKTQQKFDTAVNKAYGGKTGLGDVVTHCLFIRNIELHK